MSSRGLFRRWRIASLSAASALLLVIPLLNLRQIDFLQGWYQSLSIGNLWFVSPLEGLESILVSKTFYPPLMLGLLLPVLAALLLGRVFCGWVCPIHFFSQVGDWLKNLVAPRAGDRWRLPRWFFWGSLAGELFLTLVLGAPLFVFLSPPGLVGRELMNLVVFHTLAWEGLLVILVLGLNAATRRFYCRYLCPLGALLALLGWRRRLRVVRRAECCNACGACDNACPLGLAASRDEGTSLRCWNCGECVHVCRRDAMHFSLGPSGRSGP